MDIDDDIPQGSSSKASQQQPPKRIYIPVDDAHPFDLEGYISNYSGRTAIARLIHIVQTCPSIALEAFILAAAHIRTSRDPSQYQTLLNAYEQLTTNPDLPPELVLTPLPNIIGLAPLDTRWADETISANQAEKIKLEVELKTYSNNMIKESIRMAYRDLGCFYRSVGDYSNALKHFSKLREYCATSQHVLDMCLIVLEVLIEQRNYAHLTTYVFKAEAALEAVQNPSSSGNNGGGNGGGSGASSSKKKSPDKQAVQAKLDLATALAHLGQGNYDKAAYSFLRIGPVKELGDWVGKIIAPGDIAVYGTLCALSSMTRSALKSQLVGSSTFGVYIEQEQYIRELIEAYMSSNFKTVLELLSRYSTRHYIDIHLSPHVHDLTDRIRNWAVVLYFQPFATIKLERMSKAFGWSVDEVEMHVVQLIQAGNIQGRVDSQNKILYAKKTDYRSDLFAKAIKTAADTQALNRKLILRMKLQQADLVIKPPKGSHHAAAAMMETMASRD